MWRAEYASRALAVINFTPSLDNMDIVDFTSDSYILWMGYKYGYIYIILFSLLLLSYLSLISIKNSYMFSFIFFMVLAINFMTNNIFLSTPNNIIFPILLGVVLRGVTYYQYHQKKGVRFPLNYRVLARSNFI